MAVEQAQPQQLLTTDDLAALLNMSRQSVYNMRWKGEGPPSIRVNGRTVRYRLSDVEAWLSSQADQQAPPAA